MHYKDYYQGLEVAHNASVKEIRAAYHRLALRYHPDRNPNDAQAEEKFKEINEAYQVLSDAQKRARYDEKIGAYVEEIPRQKPGGFKASADGFSDFVNSMNEASSTARRPGSRTRRAAQEQQTRKAKPDMEADEFVIQELVSMHTIEAITYALCENYGVTWQEAKTLIADIRTRQAKLIRRKQAPWMLPATFSMLVGGIGSTIIGAYIIAFLATIPMRGGGNLALLLLPQAWFSLTQIPALLGYAWLMVGTGIGLSLGSAKGMRDAWAALSEPAEQHS